MNNPLMYRICVSVRVCVVCVLCVCVCVVCVCVCVKTIDKSSNRVTILKKVHIYICLAVDYNNRVGLLYLVVQD